VSIRNLPACCYSRTPVGRYPVCTASPAVAGSILPVPQDASFWAQVVQTPALARPTLEVSHLYTLPELVDIAERNNPETRAVWEQAKERASAAGIARSALLPTVAALASASYNQYSLFATRFYHEDLATFPATLSVNYTVFDFGARDANIGGAKANLLAADFTFNDAHRKVIFEVAEAYYRLLDAMSEEDAAQATLTDAQTVQQATEAKLANGLATLPDVLEARAETAQARYEVASIGGLEDIAHGVLANVLGVAPTGSFRVEDVSKAPLPAEVEESVQTITARALGQRPDLLAEVASLRSADAAIRGLIRRTIRQSAFRVNGATGTLMEARTSIQSSGLISIPTRRN
jgi:outer membrane protein